MIIVLVGASHSILRYLATKYGSRWYPSEPLLRAQVTLHTTTYNDTIHHMT